MSARVVILGAGFGGLELATRLSDELADQVSVTLIDQNDSFVFGFSKLDLMFGRKPVDAVRHYYRDIAKPAIEFRQETVTAIDPVARHVTTDQGSYDADVLVVALGADLDPAATPGLVEGGNEFYSVEGAERMRDVIASFDTGNAVISVLGRFFKCPAAPFETALMLHDLLERRGVRDATTITVVSPMSTPIPISPEASAGILEAVGERDIAWWPESRITSLDPATNVATLEDGRTIPYDLFLGIPVHVCPDVVLTSGLAVDGWIPVDPATFQTRYPEVFAVGDITSAPVPRVGAIAEGEAGTVADVLVHRFRGGAEPPPYGGIATCYIEFGGDRIAKFDADFLGGPTPTGSFTKPSADLAAHKEHFGTSRHDRWFGS